MIKRFNEISNRDFMEVGGKGSNLGKMYNASLCIPNGFVVTTDSYEHYIRQNNLKNKRMNEIGK